MNFRIIHFFALLLVIAATPAVIHAGEVYMWVDEKGVRHVTDQPPEKPAKIIGRDVSRPDSPEEIRQFQQSQKDYERDLEARRRYNQEMRENTNRYNAYVDQQKERSKQRDMERKERAVERIEDLNADKERRQAVENRDWNEVRRLQLRNDQRRIERDANKYKDIKDQ